MELICKSLVLCLSPILFLAQGGRGQTNSNIPNNQYWPLFVQVLSSQSGRSVQDINTLGLSDPQINTLWTSYVANMPSLSGSSSSSTTNVATTPLPPMPDLYKASYTFSTNTGASISTSGNQQSNSVSEPSNSAGLYSTLMSLLGQPSSPTPTSSSSQDVVNAYAQLAGSSNAGSSNPYMTMLQSFMGGTSGGTAGNSGETTSTSGIPDYQALLQQFGGTGTQNSASTSQPNQISYQSLLDQYKTIMSPSTTSVNSNSNSNSITSSSSGSGTSYDQLLQQYNQIMGNSQSSTVSSSPDPASLVNDYYLSLMSQTGSGGGSSSTASTGTSSTSTSSSSNDQLMQLYAQMMAGQTTGTTTNSSSVSSPTTTTTNNNNISPGTTAATPQDAFEQQLLTLFPQFQNAMPQPSSQNTSTSALSSSSTDPQSTQTAQMIFDALLFGPAPQVEQPTAEAQNQSQPATGTPSTSGGASIPSTPQAGPLNSLQNMVNPGIDTSGLLSNHVQNVMKARASRDMGCRFLPELLELDIIPSTPINCRNRCPFPRINALQLGFFCVCCPPGVNEQAVTMMSLFRGHSYMDSPLAVVT